MKTLQDQAVLVLGLGDSGLAMARWCARFGARVRVWDSRAEAPQDEALARWVPEAERLHGPLMAGPGDVRLVLKSPGLAPADERIAPLLAACASLGIPVQGELDLFAQALAELKAERGYAPAVLAITGTNGKTTTTSMTAQLVARAGRRVATAGNIGPSMLMLLLDALEQEPAPGAMVEDAAAGSVDQAPGDVDVESRIEPETETEAAVGNAVPPATAEAHREDAETDAPVEAPSSAAAEGGAEAEDVEDDAPPILPDPPPPAPVFEVLPEVWVLELSSFQLDGVRGFDPTAAVVLNLTQDHLDWHGSMDAYGAAKRRVWGAGGVVVANRDDAAVEAQVAALLAPPPPVKPARGGKPRVAKAVPRHVVRFGLDAPRAPGDWGLVVDNGMAWLVRAYESDDTLLPRRRRAAVAEAEDLQIQRLMPADALRVRGRHNAANALAALALATAAGCPLAPMLHGLREYRGEPHRVEHVATVDGIDAFDDSKGTNVGATVAAITGLGADRAPARLVVLLGGDGKGQDFAPLAGPIARHARAVATLGRDAPAIEAALGSVLAELPWQRHATLEAATRWAFAQARPGDAVLLSPACASLDMFRNYAHRAQVFVDEVQAIAQEQGVLA